MVSTPMYMCTYMFVINDSCMHAHGYVYHKRQKLSERKVLWYTGKCRENFHGFASFALKVQPLLEAFKEKTFAIHQKSMKTVKLFSGV